LTSRHLHLDDAGVVTWGWRSRTGFEEMQSQAADAVRADLKWQSHNEVVEGLAMYRSISWIAAAFLAIYHMIYMRPQHC
jgi:hypothetical protein